MKTQDYDLILLDFVLPEMQGDEISKRIRQMEKYKEVPVIMITGSREKNLAFFKSSGATDVIYRPVEYEISNEKIDTYLTN